MYQTKSAGSNIIEIVKDKLYWLSDKQPPQNQANAFFFNVDSDLNYQPFASDFGPLDFGKTYKFITELDGLLKDPSYTRSKFFHHTSTDEAKRANAAYLMGAFQIVVLGRTAEEAWKPFANVQPALAAFKDASYKSSPYRCTILDCLRGLEYGIKLGWFDIGTFNVRDYEHYEKVENGDLNWIIPGKFVAFSEPVDMPRDSDGFRRFTPEDYIPIFKKFGVTRVIRLNNKQYDEQRFIQNGIKHTDLFFVDGSCPDDNIIDEFLSIVEQEKGAVAVHCKAGLGRTGTLIAAYAMKHYKFNAADFIGYIRLCRPGSVLGPQQQFLVNKQSSFHQRGIISPIYKKIAHLVQDFHHRRENLSYQDYKGGSQFSQKTYEMSSLDRKIAVDGDKGQAERLNYAKQNRESAILTQARPPSAYDYAPRYGATATRMYSRPSTGVSVGWREKI